MPLVLMSTHRSSRQTRNSSGHLAGPLPPQPTQSQHACLTDKQAHLRECRAALCLADPWRAPSWAPGHAEPACMPHRQAGAPERVQSGLVLG